MLRLRIYYLIFIGIFFVIFAGTGNISFAQNAVANEVGLMSSREFVPPASLQGAVTFWREIFTRYGKNFAVFHYRDYPNVIYSVLDFSEYAASYSEQKLAKFKQNALKQEVVRIEKMLNYLATGAAPRNEAEQRIKDMFSRIPGGTRQKFKHATDEDQIRWQTGIQERFKSGLERSGRYLFAIEKIFKSEGLPLEIARLPLVESSFDYRAYSVVGAAGIWQFMRATGKVYMRVDNYIDERRDPILSTRAAAKYLANAYDRIQSWPVAITSYNHGVAGMMRAVEQTGTRDLATIIRRYQSKSFGFASKSFFVSFLAALEIERNKYSYFPGIVIEQPHYFDEVRIDRAISFSELVKHSGSSREEIEELNLALLKPVLNGQVRIPQGFLVKVPLGKGQSLVANLGHGKVLSLDEAGEYFTSSMKSRKSGTASVSFTGNSYTVQRGDTIGGIARKFSLSQKELMEANGLRDPRNLRAGQKLAIPGREYQPIVSKSSQVEPSDISSSRITVGSKAGTYTVKAGDTVGSIAKHYRVSQSKLMSANNISNPRRLKAGMQLKIPGGGQHVENESKPANSVSSSGASTSNTYHVVVKGDNLSKIAKQFNTSISVLRQFNPGLGSTIRPGQKIRVK